MTSQRMSLIWPLLVIAVAVLWMLQALGTLPAPAVDLIVRALPVLLVAAGLMLLLGRRVRFGNILSLVICAAIVGGAVFTAYRQQSTRVATDNHKVFTQVIEPQITSVNIVLTTLNTEISVTAGTEPSAVINAEFTGSRTSVLASDFKVDGPNGTFNLIETQDSNLPALEGLGRGKLILTLPKGDAIHQLTLNITGRAGNVSLDTGTTPLTNLSLLTDAGSITFGTLPRSLTTLSVSSLGDLDLGTLPSSLTDITLKTTTGSASFDASATSIKNLAVSATGNVTLSLPDKSGLIGDIKAGADATVTIPASIAANIRLIGNAANNPSFSQADYILNIDKVLVSRRSNEPQMQIKIEAGGRTTIQ